MLNWLPHVLCGRAQTEWAGRALGRSCFGPAPECGCAVRWSARVSQIAKSVGLLQRVDSYVRRALAQVRNKGERAFVVLEHYVITAYVSYSPIDPAFSRIGIVSERLRLLGQRLPPEQNRLAKSVIVFQAAAVSAMRRIILSKYKVIGESLSQDTLRVRVLPRDSATVYLPASLKNGTAIRQGTIDRWPFRSAANTAHNCPKCLRKYLIHKPRIAYEAETQRSVEPGIITGSGFAIFLCHFAMKIS